MKYKNKIVALIFVLCVAFIFTNTAFAVTNNTTVTAKTTTPSILSITTSNTLAAIGDSKLTLSVDFSKDQVDSVSLSKGTENIPADISITKNIMSISPVNYLEGDATYTIKIFTRKNKRYSFDVVSLNKYDYDIRDKGYVSQFGISDPNRCTPSGTHILEISPSPDKGFNYPYLLLIPWGTKENTSKKFMVVETNNSLTVSDALDFHEENAKMIAHAYGFVSTGAGGFEVATALKTPLLVPVLPRPATGGLPYYPQFLTSETLQTQDKEMQRIDLQMVAMIQDAQKILGAKGISVDKKVFMVGFSSSAKFAQRFAILQPEIVKAICVGGTAGTTTLPISKYNGEDLNFPVGIGDIKYLTGKEFNDAEFKKIAQFQYMGEQDTNDATQWGDCFNRNDAEQIWRLIGTNQMPDRFNKTQEIIISIGYGGSYQFHTYKNIGHDVSPTIESDMIEFFKANSGDNIVKIQAHKFGR